jgi:hypothetical protein
MVAFAFAENRKVAGEFVSGVAGPVETIAPVTAFTVNPSIACGSATNTKDCGVCAFNTWRAAKNNSDPARIFLTARPYQIDVAQFG